jgi:NAD(P)-dependent dehydrogenase (short-subunit alcohol dehydrogenase family)
MSNEKTWLITGCSGGLGRELAQAVLAAGHRVVATARDAERLAALVQTYGERVRTIELDVTDPHATREAARFVVEQLGSLDVLVNNAGYGDVASVEDATDESFRAQIEVNFFGVVNMTRAVLPVMRTQGSGHIVQISSVGGRVASPGLAAYQAAKWAVGGFSEVLAKEVCDLGIRVTIAEPGAMRTQWAGASMTIAEASEPYKPLIGGVARRMRQTHGKQPGDPSRIARILLDVVASPTPPLRLLLGSDAVAVAREAARLRADEDERWREVSESTSYRSAPPQA